MEIILGDGTHFESERLEKEAWLAYLYYTEHHGINMERVESVEQVCGRETLSYVFRTLELLEQDLKAGKVTRGEYEIVKLVLEWAEVAKGGTVKEREYWRKQGYALDIHNVASAEIFLSHWEENSNGGKMQGDGGPGDVERRKCGEGKSDKTTLKFMEKNMLATLIRTHGLIGQALRGEVLVAGNAPLLEVKEAIGEEAAYRVLAVLNHCIIGGVAPEIWECAEGEALGLIRRILSGDLTEFPTRERMVRLDARLGDAGEELTALFEQEIFPKYELW